MNTGKLTTIVVVSINPMELCASVLTVDECAVSPGITLARVCAVVADIAVLVVTWRYMRPTLAMPHASQVDLPRANGNAIGSLASVLVQDGALMLSRCVSAKPSQLRVVQARSTLCELHRPTQHSSAVSLLVCHLWCDSS